MADQEFLDQGTVWWPSGLGKHDQVRFVFNIALTQRPTRITCQDYESREPIDVEVIDIEQQGSGAWARYTAATIRFLKTEQDGRSFRWRVTASN